MRSHTSMKTTLVATILLLLSGSTSLLAQPGSTGMAFLKLGVGARSLGMGEAYTAAADDPSATYYNPAALTLSDRNQILLMHKEWIQDTRTEFIAGQSQFIGLHVGFSVNVTSVGNIEYRTVPGAPLGTFSARNGAIGLSAAYAFDTTLALGVTANYLYEKLFANEAAGSGFNLGLLYRSPWNVRFGASLLNLGSMSMLGRQATKLPTALRLGAADAFPIEALDGRLTVSADFVSLTAEKTSHLHAGAELTYRDQFAVRAGYLTGYEGRSLTAGIGVRYSLLTFDYAFAPFRYELGTTHSLSLGFVF